jgi:hypothetical protein
MDVMEAHKATSPDKTDPVGLVIKLATALLRKHFPELCSKSDDERRTQGLPPQGPTGLVYIGRRLQVLSTKTLLAVTQDGNDAFSEVLKDIHGDRFLIEAHLTLAREIAVLDRIKEVAEHAVSLPKAKRDGRDPGAICNDIVASLRSFFTFRFKPRGPWEDDLNSFAKELEYLITPDTDYGDVDADYGLKDEFAGDSRTYDSNGFEVVVS